MSDQFDLSSLLQQAQQMQQQLLDKQQEIAEQVVEGHAGGGAVSVTVTGGMDFRSVRIDPAAVDLDDLTLLEDLVLAALHDAVARVQELNADAMGGLGLGALQGMGGLPSDAMDEAMDTTATDEPEH